MEQMLLLKQQIPTFGTMQLKILLKKAKTPNGSLYRWAARPKKMQLEDVERVATLNGIRPVDLAAEIFALPDQPEAKQLELFSPEGGEV